MSVEQLSNAFEAEHRSWVAKVTGKYAKDFKMSREDISQSVWEGLIRAYRKYQPGAQSLHTWARVFVLQALQRVEPELLSVPTTTEYLYRKVMTAADWDIQAAAQLCRSRKWGISERTLIQVFVAKQPWVSLDEPVGSDESGEALRLSDVI